MARRAGRKSPVVISSTLYGADESFQIESPAWWTWLNNGTSFYVDYVERPASMGGYTVRREMRRDSYFWYAFKTVNGKLYKAYVGRTHELTAARLVEVSNQLEGRIKAAQSAKSELS